MKQLFVLLLFFSLLALTACTTAPKADINLEKQLQKEEYDFEQALGKLVTQLSSIKHPNDLGIGSIFPGTWLVEAYDDRAGSNVQRYGIGMPIAKEVGRDVGYAKSQENLPSSRDWYRLERSGSLTPDTSLYIAPRWTGQPYNWGSIQVSNQDMKNFPKAENLDCFKAEKVIRQPYMVPAEATHGIYLESHKKLSATSINNLVNIVQQIQGANPYKEKTYSEQLRTPPLAQFLEQIQPEAAKIGDDADILIAFATSLNTKYFSKNPLVWDKQNELTSYTDALKKIKTQLSGIAEYVQPIKQWDFSNLEKYRALKKK